MSRTFLDIKSVEPIETGSASPENEHMAKKSRLGRFRASEYILAVEVAHGAFRYVMLNPARSGYEMIAYGLMRPEDLSIGSIEIKELLEAGINWLKANIDGKIGKIYVVSADLDFFVRRLEIPRLRKRRLLSAVAWQLDKLVPIPIESSYLRIKRVKEESKIISLTIGAVPRPRVDQWDFVGHSLEGVVPTSAALAALGPKATSADSAYCYVYCDKNYLSIGFYNSDGLQYAHPAHFQAKKLFETEDPGISDKKVVEDIVGSVEVFYSYFPDITIHGLILFADRKKSQSVSAAIREHLELEIIAIDLPAEYFAPHSRVKPALDIEFMPLLGAPLVTKNDFRFLPQSIEAEQRFRKMKKIAAYCLAAGVLLGVLLSAYWMADVRSLEMNLARKEATKARLISSEGYRKISDYRDATEFMAFLEKQLKSNNSRYSSLLKTLSSVTPAGIYLQNVTTSGEEGSLRVSVAGYYDGDLSKADIAIMNFMEALGTRNVDRLKLQRLGQKLSGKRKIESFQLDGLWR